jgi:chromosome segregation ATPase
MENLLDFSGLSGVLGDILTRLASVEQVSNAAQTQSVQELSDKISQNTAWIDQLGTKQNTTNDSVIALQSTVETQAAELHALKSQVAERDTTIASLQDEISHLVDTQQNMLTKIEQVESFCEKWNPTLQSIDDRMNALEGAFHRMSKAHRRRTSNMSSISASSHPNAASATPAAAVDHDSVVEGMELRIASLETATLNLPENVQSLQQDVDGLKRAMKRTVARVSL